MDIRQIFARNLRKIRQERGLSQEALAHEAGLDRSYVSALERGTYNASIKTLDQLGRALKVDPAEFLRSPKAGKTGLTADCR